MEATRPGFAESELGGHLIEARAFEVMAAHELCFFARQLGDFSANQAEQLSLAVSLLRVVASIDERAIARITMGSRRDQTNRHRGRHRRQMIDQGKFGIGWAGAGRTRDGDVFKGAFADARGRLQTVQALVGSTRETRGRTHAIDDCSAYSEIRVATEWHATRAVEPPSGVPQPFAPEAEQLFEIARSTERTQDLARNHVHQPQG